MRCTWAFAATCCRPTASPIIWRAWLDPARLAAHGVTAADVYRALTANNYLAAVGTTKGQMVSVDLTAGTDLHSVEEFKQLSIKQSNGAIVRLEDVATVVLGAEDYNLTSRSAASWRCSSASRWRRMRTSSKSRNACAMRCPTSRRNCRAACPARSS